MRKGPVDRKVLLRQINRLRVAVNNEPINEIPKGEIGGSLSCPIAIALKNGIEPRVNSGLVSLSYSPKPEEDELKKIVHRLKAAGFRAVEVRYGVFTTDVRLKPTQMMLNFIDRFDNGEFQDLVAGLDD